MFAKPRCRYPPSIANSTFSYKVGNWHASPPLRRETAVTGPSFLAAATNSVWPDNCPQDIHGPFGGPNLFFFPPARRGLRGTPTSYSKERATAEVEFRNFRWGFLKYWKKLPAPVDILSSVNVFKKVGENLDTLRQCIPIYKSQVKCKINWERRSKVFLPTNHSSCKAENLMLWC